MRIDGPARRRRLLTFVATAAAIVAGVALTPIAANAVHDEGLFELEGNIADASGVPGHDWSTFHGAMPPGGVAPIDTVFIADGFNGIDDTIYFGGGSQNNNDIPSWQWSCGSVSTKSDLEHAFASAYITDDQLFLYFGADRYDPTGGTTNVGFWFLQSGGALQGGSGCPDSNPAANTFSGQHVDGDLFVFAEFNGGGGDSAVSMYEWSSGGLHLLASKSSGSFCSADDSICALTNDETIDSTWPYRDNQSSSADGQILQGGFVEGGINLSAIYEGLGKDLPCVNRFLAQTGSSHPDTGVLEDFAGGSFNVCSKLIVDKVAPSGDQTAFPFAVSGPNGYADSFQLADADAPHDSGQIKSGTYQVTETPGDASVWNPPSVSCEDQGSNAVSYGPNGAVSIAPGATVTCRFTNTKKPRLTVVKKIVGGNGTTDAFDVAVDGATKLDNAASTAPAGTSSGSFAVSPGAHAVSETLADGSTPVDPSDWSVSFGGDCNSVGEVSVQNDESKTCTITNSKLPKLRVVKEIEGGDGSTFDISVAGTKVLDDAGDGASDERSYAPGTYGVTETFGDGGAIGADWTVVFSGDCDASGSISLAYGDAKSCTVTNRRKPKLTLVKVIEGGNGASFDLRVNGATVLDDVSGSGGQVTNTYPVATEYSVSETLGNGGAVDPAVWETSTSGDCSGTLAAGDEKTCTITNRRKPKLTVVKVIEGGNGASFDLRVNGSTVFDDVGGSGGQVTNTYPVATEYSVSETLGNGGAVDPALWNTSMSGDCSGTLAAGDDKTCTITNRRKPRLTVVKRIVGGDGSNFDLSVNGTKVLDDAGDAAADTRSYEPGAYAVSETLGNGDPIPSGWSTAFSGDCNESGNIALAYGDEKTCTVTNSKLPLLTVVKEVVGGIKSPGDFQMSVSGIDPSPSSFPGSSAGTVVTLGPGAYAASETEDPHYAASYSADCSGTVAYGESKACTVTNTRKPSGIAIEKVASPTSVPEPGGQVTFTFTVRNTSPADIVTLTELSDSVYGDLFTRGDCDALEGKQLAPDNGAAGGPDEATCSFSAVVAGNAGDIHHNVATVKGHDEDERPVTDSDSADVELTDVAPSIEVTKTADPESLPEPGGPVEFRVEVKNTSVASDPVTITTLVDDPDGTGPAEPIDLDGLGSCAVPQTIQPGATYTCTFMRAISGNAGDLKTDVVTASGHDDEGHEVSDDDDATVELTDVPSSIALEKSANPTSVQAPGGDVTFTVVVRNTSAADAVTIDSLVDNVYGDLSGKGSCGALIGKVLQPDDHAAGGPDEASCSFTAAVTGPGGSSHTDVVTVTAHDDDGEDLTAHDDATVTITPLIDLWVTKTDLPDPVRLNGELTYSIVVGNDGPDAATQVTLADPLPAGTSFISVSATQGSCAGGALITCNLGTIAKGATVTITLVVRAEQAGTLTNTATVVGKEPESSTANNRATATTLVVAPVLRRPAQAVCDRFTATPKSLTVGRRSTIVVRVTAGGKPAAGRRVVVKGAGINKSARTNRKGIARIVVRPRRSGIVTITVPQRIVCGSRRIGVVGAFQPPVTG